MYSASDNCLKLAGTALLSHVQLYSVMFSKAAPLSVNADQKRELEALVRNGFPGRKWRYVAAGHQGVPNQSIAQQLNVSRPTTLVLRAAFSRDGMTEPERMP
jgi:hypothetical protein